MKLSDQVVADVATANGFVDVAIAHIHDGWAKVMAGELEAGCAEMEQARTWLARAIEYLQLARQPRLYDPIRDIEAWLQQVVKAGLTGD